MNGKSFTAKPFGLDPYSRDAQDMPRFSDWAKRKNITGKNTSDPIANELVNAEQHQIYNFDCVQQIGTTMNLDGQNRLAVASRLIVLAAEEKASMFSSTKKYWRVDSAATVKAIEAVHTQLGIKPDWGKPGANIAFRRLAAAWSGARLLTIPLDAIKKIYQPYHGFDVEVIVEYAHYELALKTGVPDSIVLFALPERVHIAVEVYQHCHEEINEKLEVREWVNIGKEATLVDEFPTAHGKALLEEAHAARKRADEERERKAEQDAVAKAKEEREEAEDLIKHLEEQLEEANKDLEEAKAAEEAAKEAAGD